MGSSTLLRRDCENACSRPLEAEEFNFCAFQGSHGNFDAFNFSVGGDVRTDAYADVSGATSVSAGIQAFFQLSDISKATHSAKYGASDDYEQMFRVEGDDLDQGWTSPRISFSQDLAFEELKKSESSGVASPDKRRWQGGADEEDLHSSEFEFLSSGGVAYNGFPHRKDDPMMSAEELFSDGKILPMNAQEMIQSSNDNLKLTRSGLTDSHSTEGISEPRYGEVTECSSKFSSSDADRSDPCINLKQKDVVTSIDIPRPKPPSSCEVAHPLDVGADISPSSSPPRSSNSPANELNDVTSMSCAPHRANSKYSFKIKELFKHKRSNSSINPHLTRDNSSAATPTCRIPIASRSFWPFLRSNSAGESKTTTPPVPTLPPRSNSAGDGNTSRTTQKPDQGALLNVDKDAGILDSNARDNVEPATEILPITQAQADADLPSNCAAMESTSGCAEHLKQVSDEEEESALSINSRRIHLSKGKGRLSGSPGRSARRRYIYTASNFLRGSPGRRGGMGSLAKVNASRIMLRNLERCSAERRLFRESSARRAISYPVSVRVSPVLNVAVYRGGKVPSAGIFGLRGFFSSNKKQQQPQQQQQQQLNNWRSDA
ncbi:hypothetical protein KP509_31G057000 [Ceratopteris richardii]|uniref:Uncharacterized protein n=1 Tax=Ceratopteris richardii TaxID=49495 RepID=A0A8T2R051_CERRI|nr:hypothetical protein KP509_31G057000 [Ceratopteris richardii]